MACEKHDATMDRVFTEINDFKTKVTAQVADVKSQLMLLNEKMDKSCEFNDAMHKLVYGNGKEGFLSKLNRLNSQIILQWGLFVVMLGFIVFKR